VSLVEDILDATSTALDGLQFDLPTAEDNFNSMDDAELRDRLSKYGAYAGYLQIQLARLESTKTTLDHVLEASTYRRMAQTPVEGRMLKDAQMAGIVAGDEKLREIQKSLLFAQAQFVAMVRVENALDILWRTVSRILSSRDAEAQRMKP
jgi:hypothetical protein